MTRLVDLVLAVDEALDAAAIAHAFGGALALAYAIAEPRGTRDIDVNVFVPSDDAERAFRALPDGVSWTAADVDLAARDDQVRLHWGETPIDLFFNTHRFHQLAARRTHEVPLAGRTVPVLDPTDLAVFKVLFDRTRDWADLEAMQEVGSVDVADGLGWLEELIGPDDDRTRRFVALFT